MLAPQSFVLKNDRSALVVLCLLVVLITGCLFHVAAGYSDSTWESGHAWGFDDAYISYRYAKNLATGHGLVFNEGERVEGYSNLLYTLMISPAFLVLDDEHIYFFSITVNIVLISMAFLLFNSHVKATLCTRGALICAVLFALYPAIWAAVATGMETALVILLQIGIWVTVERIVASERRRRPLALMSMCALSIFARADGFLMPALAVAYLLVKSRRREAEYTATTILATIAVYFSWRYSYYGYFLPNTFYAKVSGPLKERIGHALDQVREIFIQQGLVPYAVAFVFSWVEIVRRAALQLRHAPRFLEFDTLFGAFWLLYWSYIGGDHLGDRFLIPMVLLLMFSTVKLVTSIQNAKGLAYVAILLASLLLTTVYVDGRFRHSLGKYDCWITLGKYLADRHEDELLAVGAAGKIPFFSGMRTLDMLGLNDEHIGHMSVDSFLVGHNKYDPQYVFSKQPDLIATWITSDQLDMNVGLSREKYLEAGYEIGYMVETNSSASSTPIVDVRGFDKDEVSALRKRGYYFGVLLKKTELE